MIMFTQRQEEIFQGMMLGDGYLENRGTANTRLQIRHAISQRSYVDWLYQEFENFVAKPPRQIGEAYFFRTRSYPWLTSLRKVYYPDGTKRIPSDLFLTPLGLAVWFMDDGYLDQKAAYFCTHAFDTQSIERARIMLSRYHLESGLVRDRNHFKIRLKVVSTPLFIKLIQSYIHSSLLYKISKAP